MTPTTKMKTPAEIAELYAAAAIAAQNAGVANRGFSEALARAFETHAEKDVTEVDRRQAEKDEKHRAFMDAMQALRDAIAEFDFTASAYANA